ncbi:MAG: PorV/PorQ family protein [Salinivirgaceae bacterium]|jgi:hypothetical protein|nr:PorV/PorQ family protein [Salinivirgaceae bacterium]
MKKSILTYFIFASIALSVQAQYGLTSDLFFNRQPSTRSEAMGKAYASIDGDLSTQYYNPAGISTIKGFEFQSSFATPRYTDKKGKYLFFSLGYNINQYLTIALSQNHFTKGEKFYLTDDNGDILADFTPFTSNTSLSLASQPIKNLFIGCNLNIMQLNVLDEINKAPYFDIGVIKKLLVFQNSSSNHSCNFGASIVNFTSARIKYFQDYKQKIPTLVRIGTSYRLNINKNILIENLETFEFLYQIDYQNQLNFDYNSAIRTGAEFSFLEILALRVGYYYEKVDDYGFSDFNKSIFTTLTYGIGIQLPLYKLRKLPFNIKLNYTNLPQENYTTRPSEYKNFTSFSLQINWILSSDK